jgi:hypothetical protein
MHRFIVVPARPLVLWPNGKRASLLVAMAMVVCATPALAENVGWTANATVKKLVVTSDGGVNVLLSPSLTTCVAQDGYGNQMASIPATHPGLKQIKADLLTAFVTGTPVSLYLVDSTCKVGETILGGW